VPVTDLHGLPGTVFIFVKEPLLLSRRQTIMASRALCVFLLLAPLLHSQDNSVEAPLLILARVASGSRKRSSNSPASKTCASLSNTLTETRWTSLLQ
jgi:hypothetical protein